MEGYVFWPGSLQWWLPLIGELDHEIVDNTAALDSVDGSLFYDVGHLYLFGRPQGATDHAIGAGLYFESSVLSFVERRTICTEYGYSMLNQTSAF